MNRNKLRLPPWSSTYGRIVSTPKEENRAWIVRHEDRLPSACAEEPSRWRDWVHASVGRYPTFRPGRNRIGASHVQFSATTLAAVRRMGLRVDRILQQKATVEPASVYVVQSRQFHSRSRTWPKRFSAFSSRAQSRPPLESGAPVRRSPLERLPPSQSNGVRTGGTGDRFQKNWGIDNKCRSYVYSAPALFQNDAGQKVATGSGACYVDPLRLQPSKHSYSLSNITVVRCHCFSSRKLLLWALSLLILLPDFSRAQDTPAQAPPANSLPVKRYEVPELPTPNFKVKPNRPGAPTPGEYDIHADNQVREGKRSLTSAATSPSKAPRWS